RDVRVRNVPLPVMRVAAIATKPISRKASRLVHAGIVMDTTDMSFDAMPVRLAHPQIPVTTLEAVVEQDWLNPAA
ncbi:MAG: hypothetical protein JWL83_3, partial [Actinomycetia bacterium]|nr:hypothetical protein [Actinomycetes bacterium]